MQSNNIFQTPVSPVSRVPGVASTPVRPDFVAIAPGGGDESEKKQFIQTILITFGICSIITVVLFFLLLSNSSEASTAATPTKYTVKEDPVKAIIPTPRKPTPTPVKKPTPTVPAVVKSTIAPTPTGAITPVVTVTPAPTNTPTSSPTLTPSPTSTVTATPTLTPTPTGSVTLSTELSSGTMNLGSVLINSGESWGEVIIRNGTASAINLTDLFFSVSGSTNPYSIMDGADCLTNSLLPYSLPSGSTKCLRVKFKPVTGSNVANTIILYWNTSNLKSFSLTGVILTPTPTPTP